MLDALADRDDGSRAPMKQGSLQGGAEAACGEGVLADEVRAVGDYVALVDPIAWTLCRSSLSEPLQVIAPESRQQRELDTLQPALPGRVRVAGVGGGLVIDAPKYLALATPCPLVLVPSITPSNAPFTSRMPIRRDGEPVRVAAPRQARRLVVDFSLIARADPRLNRAGYADLLVTESAMREWRWYTSAEEMALRRKDVVEFLEPAARWRPDAPVGANCSAEALMRMFADLQPSRAALPKLPSGTAGDLLPGTSGP